MLIVHENQPTLKHVKGASWCKLRHAKIEGGKCTRKVICLSNNPIHHMHKLLPLLEMLQFEIGHTQNEMHIIFLYSSTVCVSVQLFLYEGLLYMNILCTSYIYLRINISYNCKNKTFKR